MSSWEMYWLLSLDGIKAVLEALVVIGGTLGTLLIIVYCIAKCIAFFDDEDEDAAKLAKVLRLPMIYVLIMVLLGTLGWILFPTTKQMAAIIVVPKIVNNEKAQELPENLLDLCNEWTKNKAEELKGE